MTECSHLALLQLNFSRDFFSLDFAESPFSHSLDSIAAFISQLQTAIATAIQHPFLSILALLVGIGIIQLIADLVKRILKASLAFLLTLPLTLSQWIWKRATAPSTPSKDAQIQQLLARLETLKEEEAQIIGALKSLLSSTSQTTLEGVGSNSTKTDQPTAIPAAKTAATETPALESATSEPIVTEN